MKRFAWLSTALCAACLDLSALQPVDNDLSFVPNVDFAGVALDLRFANDLRQPFDIAGLSVLSFGDNNSDNIKGVLLDTYVSQSSPENAKGNDTELSLAFSTEDVALLRFELSALSSTTTVDQAVLILQTSSTAFQNRTVDLAQLSQSWDEDATWNRRNAMDDWIAAGCKPPSRGNNFASFTVVSGQNEIDVTAVVQGWLSAPGNNRGFALSSPSVGTGAFVSQLGADTKRPSLRVTYH